MTQGSPIGTGQFRIRALTVLVLITVLGYLGMSLWSGWRSVLAAVSQVGALGIVVGLSLSLLNCACRFLRWQQYLDALGYHVPALASFKIYMAGFALTATPGSAGESVVRSVYLKSYGMPYSKSFAAYVSERISDLISISALTAVGLLAYRPAWPLVGVVVAVISLALLMMWQAVWLEKMSTWLRSRRATVANLAAHGVDIIAHSRQCFSPLLMAKGVFWGLLAWGATSLAFYYFLQLLGSQITLQSAVFIYTLSILAGAVSFLPGGVGTAEATMIGLLILSELLPAQAVAVTILIRCVTLWFPVAVGIGYFFFLPQQGDGLRNGTRAD